MTAVKSEYPKSLLKRDAGALFEKVVHSAAEEAQARTEGYKTAKELWP